MTKRSIPGVLAALALLSLAVLGATSASAKKPGSGGGQVSQGSTIRLNASDPHLGDWVTFSYTTPETRQSIRIQIMCTQDGVVTYGMADAATAAFELGGGSSAWRTNGGEADCTATLYYWDWRPIQTFVPLAETSFRAGGWR